jgi:hypothetical protein
VCAFLVWNVEVYSAAASVLGLACQQDLVTVVVPALCVVVGCVCPDLVIEPLDQMLKILESSSCSRGDFSDKPVRCLMKCL